MNQRITFIHEPGRSFDPSQLRLQNDTLHVNALEAGREDRLTISLYELPQEVSTMINTKVTIFQVLIAREVMASVEAMS